MRIALVLCIYRRLWHSFQFLVVVLFSCLGGLSIFSFIASKILFFRPVIKLSSISQSAKNRKSGGKKGTGNWTGPFFRTGSQWCTFSSTAVFWGSWYRGDVSLLYSCETHVPVSLPSLGQRYLPAFFGDLKPIKNPLSAKGLKCIDIVNLSLTSHSVSQMENWYGWNAIRVCWKPWGRRQTGSIADPRKPI